MPQALPAIGAFFVKVFTAKAIGYVIARTLLVNFAIGYLSRALAGKPSGRNEPIAQTLQVRSSTQPREKVYGQVKKSGVVIFETTSGDNNKFYWRVLAISGTQMEEFTDVWLDGTQIAAADINWTTGAVSGTSIYAGKVLLFKKMGTKAQTVLSQLDDVSSEWASNHRGAGQALLFMRCERDQDAFPNGPPDEVFVLCKGCRMYDPRKDSTNGGSGSHRLADATTWEWSDNPALCEADYMTGGSLWFDDATPVPLMGMQIGTSYINWTYVAASANECDELVNIPGSTTQKRYTCNGVLSAADDHETNMGKIAACMAGPIPVFTAGQYRVIAGQYDAPTHTIRDADLNGGWDMVGCAGLEERVNSTTGVYFDPARNYEQVPCAIRTSSTYVSEDGVRKIKNYDLSLLNNEYRAQRLMEVELQKTRDQATVRFSGGPSLLAIAPWETFDVSLAEMPAWMVGKTFRAVATELDFSLPPKIVVDAKVESSSTWTDPDPSTGYITPNTGSSTPITETPGAIDSINIVGDVDSVIVSWPFPTVWFPRWRIEVWEHTSATPFSSATKVWEGIDTHARIPRTTTGNRYYWVRIKGLRGQYSATTPATNGQPGAPKSITTGFQIVLDRESHNRILIGTGSGNTTNTTTVTPINAVGAVTYSWSQISGDATIDAIAPTSATTGFSNSGMNNGDIETATFEVDAFDTATHVIKQVQIRFERNDTFEL